MAPEKHKRRQILIDADLQVGLSMNLLGWLYFYVVIFALLANAPSIWAVFTETSADVGYFDAVQRLQWFTQFTVLPLAVTFVCVALHSIVFTHRVAGPIYRIKATLRDMAQRKYQARPVTLRDKDYFKDVAADLTTVISALREDAARERRMNQETLDGAKELIDALERGDQSKEEVLALAHLALDRAERLDRHLAAIHDEPAAPRVPMPEAEIAATLASPPAGAPAAPEPAAAGAKS